MEQHFKELQEWAKDINLLIIEDEKDVRESLKEFFNNFFSRVQALNNGLEAYHHLHFIADYNIIISDIKMPHLDGLQVSKILSNRFKDKKLILISGQTNPDKIDNYRDLKVDLFLAKPLKMDFLVETLVGFCKEIKAA